jgi:hypothetical protein
LPLGAAIYNDFKMLKKPYTDEILIKAEQISTKLTEMSLEKSRLSSASGIFAKTKARAKQKIIEGKIFLEKRNLNELFLNFGKKVVNENNEQEYIDIAQSTIESILAKKQQISVYRNDIEKSNNNLFMEKTDAESEYKTLMIENSENFLSEAEILETKIAESFDELNEKSIDLYYETYLCLKDRNLDNEDLRQYINEYSNQITELSVKRDNDSPDHGRLKKKFVAAGIIGVGALNLFTLGVPTLILAGACGVAAAKGTKWVRNKRNRDQSAICLCYRCDNPGPHYFHEIDRTVLGSAGAGLIGGAIGGCIASIIAGKLYRCRKCGAILKDSGQSVWLASEAIKHFKDYPEIHKNMSTLQTLIAAKDENIKALLSKHNTEINELEQEFITHKLNNEELSKRLTYLMSIMQQSKGNSIDGLRAA